MSVFPEEVYRLSKPIQLLNEKLIREQINQQGSISVLKITDSTNQYLLDRLNTLYSGDVCIAEYQRVGRGRRLNKWFSPFGLNLYFSMYWNLRRKFNVSSLSLMISIVIAEVLHNIGANQVRIKWPNDLYLFDRKLAGILIELSTRKNEIAKIVIGAGINLIMRFAREEEINQNWISLQEAGINVNRDLLIVQLIKELRNSLKCFEQNGFLPFFHRWKKLDNFINRRIKLVVGDKEIYGISRGINEQGALLLEQNGIIYPWMDGEVSLRKVEENYFI